MILGAVGVGDPEGGVVSELDRYRPLARSLARRFYIPGADSDDVEQEAMIGAWEALTTWDPTRGPLVAFVRLVAERRVIEMVKRARARKHLALTDRAGPVRNEDGDEILPVDLVVDVRADPAGIAEHRETLAEILDVIAHDLSPLERRVLIGVANGLAYTDLGDFKSVDNALQRARRKVADPPTVAVAA